jgi:hypothetical protein
MTLEGEVRFDDDTTGAVTVISPANGVVEAEVLRLTRPDRS